MLWLATRSLFSRNEALICPGIKGTGRWQLTVESFSGNCLQLKGAPSPKVRTSSYCYWHLMMDVEVAKGRPLYLNYGQLWDTIPVPELPICDLRFLLQVHHNSTFLQTSPASAILLQVMFLREFSNKHDCKFLLQNLCPRKTNLRQVPLTERPSWFQRC